MKKISFLFFICFADVLFAQTAYQFKLTRSFEQCTRAYALLDIKGTGAADSVSIHWNTGQNDLVELTDLIGGDYSVHIKIKHRKDSVLSPTKDTIIVRIKDTLINFTIEKKECVVQIPKYFSPNGDNYADVLGISNIGNYPDFELSIFNKWGQRVHHQKSVYIPWDGKWVGVDLPDGTYYYVLFYDAANRNHFVKGDITIIR